MAIPKVSNIDTKSLFLARIVDYRSYFDTKISDATGRTEVLVIQESKNGVRIRLYVQPNGKRNEIIGEYDGALKIRIQAAPVEGQANAAVTEFVAKLFAVPRSRVSLVRGMQSRLKVIEITGIDIASARLKLASAL